MRSVFKIPFGSYNESWIVSFGADTFVEYYCCECCESVFKNPYDSNENQYWSGWNSYRIDAFKKGVQQGYRDRYASIAPHIPKDSEVVVDAACGGAEYLRLIREDPSLHVGHLVGFELESAIAEYVRSLGFDGRQADVKIPGYAPDLEGRADCVIFSEAFEHVVFPLRTIGYLMKLLRPGGMLWFSAQRVAPALRMKIHEDTAVTKEGISLMAERLHCSVVSMDAVCEENPAWYVVFQKGKVLECFPTSCQNKL